MNSLFVSIPLTALVGYFSTSYLLQPDALILVTINGFVLGFVCSKLLD